MVASSTGNVCGKGPRAFQIETEPYEFGIGYAAAKIPQVHQEMYFDRPHALTLP
jgi:hypothetical protein